MGPCVCVGCRTQAYRRTSGEVVLSSARDVDQSLAVVATNAQRSSTGRPTDAAAVAVVRPPVGARRERGVTQRRNGEIAAPERHLAAERRHLRQRVYVCQATTAV